MPKAAKVYKANRSGPVQRARQENRANAYRRGYDRKWKRYRLLFLAENPLCVDCGREAEHVDHIEPHRGNRDVFWDTDNHQAMCASCHSKKTNRGL